MLGSTEIFEYVPLGDVLSALGEHFVPVLDLHRSALTAQHELADRLVPAHPIVVHDGDDQAGLTDLLVGDVEDEGLVEDRVQVLLVDLRLLLLHLLPVMHQPYLDVRIYNNM